MALPSGYEYADYVYRNNSSSVTTSPYFDLGVVPTSEMEVDILMRATGEYKEWLFGSRYTNSNTSVEQLNLYYGGQTSATQIGYASARISLGNDAFPYGITNFQKKGNEFVINDGNAVLYEKTGATTSFTGRRNMYLFALNNAGTASFGTDASAGAFAGIRIYESDVLTHEFLPVYDTVNNEQCLYDTVGDSVISKSGSGSWNYYTVNSHYLLSVESTDGGYAFITTMTNKRVNKIYTHYAPGDVTLFDIKGWGRNVLTANAYNGYSFDGWEINGQIISKDNEIYLGGISADTTVKALFVKNVPDEQKNKSQLICFNYGLNTTEQSALLSFIPVLSAKINEDGLTKTNSTIVCETLPSSVAVNSLVLLKNPKGKELYYGVIKSIEDNVLTCREPLSLFDADFLFGATASSSLTIMRAVYTYLANYVAGYPSYEQVFEHMNPSVRRECRHAEAVFETMLSFDNKQNLNITQPAIDSINISNLEDYIINAFNDFGVSIKYKFGDSLYTSPTRKKIRFYVTNPRLDEPLVLSNNSEAITNVQIDVQDMETTVLTVYNSTGATFRGQYSVKYDGTITDYTVDHQSNANFIAYNSCKPKIVMSDDKLTVLVEQYLTNAKYNHKITFDLNLSNDLYSFDDFKIGRRVNFYYKEKLYESIITGFEWEIAENQEQPYTVKVILGKVRNKLTTKINLGKTKK